MSELSIMVTSGHIVKKRKDPRPSDVKNRKENQSVRHTDPTPVFTVYREGPVPSFLRIRLKVKREEEVSLSPPVYNSTTSTFLFRRT